MVKQMTASTADLVVLFESAGPASNDSHVDRCSASSLATGADIVVVPRVELLDRGVAPVVRW